MTPARLSAVSALRPYLTLPTSRCIHNTRAGQASLAATTTISSAPSSPPSTLQHHPPSASKVAPLSCLPLSQVLRTYLISSVSSSPALLSACTSILMRMLNSESPLTSVERNPILKLLLRETFYKQFCAGANRADVQQCMKQLQDIGYHGIILEYALEVLKDAKSVDEAKDVEVWRQGLLETVDLANPGDFVGLKWSGMGPGALHRLKANENPSTLMDKAMREVCELSASKNVKLLPAAEETTTTAGIDAWSLGLQRDFNKGKNGSVVYNTYQAYLRQTGATLAKHLADAQKEGYTLGIKLVRGAYLGSEPKQLIWGSKEETDTAYDTLAAGLLKREYNGMLTAVQRADSNSFPGIEVMLATHNAASVRKAQAIRTQQTQNKEYKIPLGYAQLQGMADEVSCEIVQAAKVSPSDGELVDLPKAYKCTTWGTMTECLNYLLRRAAENKDAAQRTHESRDAMSAELRRRFKAVFGVA